MEVNNETTMFKETESIAFRPLKTVNIVGNNDFFLLKYCFSGTYPRAHSLSRECRSERPNPSSSSRVQTIISAGRMMIGCRLFASLSTRSTATKTLALLGMGPFISARAEGALDSGVTSQIIAKRVDIV